MELVTYRSRRGDRAGALVAGRVHDVEDGTHVHTDATVLGLLEDWPAACQRLCALAKGAHSGGGIAADGVRLLAPLPNPVNIFCAGANYADHAAEMPAARASADVHANGRPWHFLKASRTVVGPGEIVAVPEGNARLDWEVELAAVIGLKGRAIPVAEALSHVAGYTIAIDFSARGLSRRANYPEGSPFRLDWLAHKSFDGSCPMGPVIVTADAIPDPQALGIGLSVNDAVRQSSTTGAMIYSIAEQISALSERLTLWPGDLVLTGTPAGVGMGRDEYLRPGDVVTARIERLGELTARLA